jgi:hypothetical protein
MELFLLYVWMKLTTIQVVLGLSIATGCAVALGCFIALMDDSVPQRYIYDTREEWEAAVKEKKEKTTPYKLLQRLRWIIPAMVALLLVIPSQTQTAVLVAGYYALRMADSPEASKVVQVLRKKANEYLDEELKEVKK